MNGTYKGLVIPEVSHTNGDKSDGTVNKETVKSFLAGKNCIAWTIRCAPSYQVDPCKECIYGNKEAVLDYYISKGEITTTDKFEFFMLGLLK